MGMRAGLGWVQATAQHGKEQRSGGEKPEQTEVLSPYRWQTKSTGEMLSKPCAIRVDNYRNSEDYMCRNDMGLEDSLKL